MDVSAMPSKLAAAATIASAVIGASSWLNWQSKAAAKAASAFGGNLRVTRILGLFSPLFMSMLSCVSTV